MIQRPLPWPACQSGDASAYLDLLRTLTPRVRRIVARQRAFAGAEDVEDLVQDIPVVAPCGTPLTIQRGPLCHSCWRSFGTDLPMALGDLSLELTGPPGTREFLTALFES